MLSTGSGVKAKIVEVGVEDCAFVGTSLELVPCRTAKRSSVSGTSAQ